MFYNILKRSFQANIKNVNNLNLLRLSSSNGPQGDIKDAMDIEANLFGNSDLKHEPVNTREALRKNRTKPSVSRKVKEGSAPVVPRKFTAPGIPAPRKAPVPAPVIKDSELSLEFVRLTLQDPLTSTLLTTVRSRKRRDKNRQIIVEGRRLILEALQCGLKMETLLFSQKDQLTLVKEEVGRAQVETHTKIYKVPQHDLKTWSSLVTPPGLMAIFDRPSEKGLEKNLAEQQSLGTKPLPITVVCDNIREPNNLGSIIRTCAALPCSQVVVTHGCCDPWESKSLRGGCGGQFRVPIRDDVPWDELSLTIPPEAADDCHVFIAESNQNKREHNQTIDYAEIKDIGTHNLLIIGGESHGVSEEAYRFLNLVGRKGKCVYIPLAAGIDSLNVASALTLLLFEMRRKLNEQAIVKD
ncbi:rRNA methyltransferase 3, mitochondrial [Drosophila eugracilis]|uniref:rRNA methyltransferase 3, mitochondrial n=1 Tax=Drosophila eugracilis TaxID=29029 RepID=UPI0007E7F7DE|nr:rRNA methyltransferase 3, mitochondrial [Drosophila eugracilis]XP_017072435.1 rRNA methyltransferase 3, mitochondrial [Drosophila eugracilis]